MTIEVLFYAFLFDILLAVVVTKIIKEKIYRLSDFGFGWGALCGFLFPKLWLYFMYASIIKAFGQKEEELRGSKTKDAKKKIAYLKECRQDFFKGNNRGFTYKIIVIVVIMLFCLGLEFLSPYN